MDGGKPLAGALARCRTGLVGVGVLSAALNLLALTGSFFMLEVYDRVIPGRSVPTLVGLCVVALGLYAFQAVFEALRSRILARLGSLLDRDLSPLAFHAYTLGPIRGGAASPSGSALKDLDQVRGFLAGPGPGALFDLPWIPFYLALCFGFHFWIGVTAVVGGVVMAVLTVVADRMATGSVKTTLGLYAKRSAITDAARRNAEALHALGMRGHVARAWGKVSDAYLDSSRGGSDVTSALSTVSKVFRSALQSATLAIGAYLVIHGEATSGIMIASSILLSRALAPVETAIAHWKGFASARMSWKRLGLALRQGPPAEPMALPAPVASLLVEGVSVAAPGGQRVLLHDASLRLRAGEAVAILGPSGSGKSVLARTMVGAWLPGRGKVRLDGAAIDQWDPDALGRHVGYLPQDVELFEGTIAQNIARFDPDASPEAIIEAAKAASVHDLVLRQPEGYETRIGEGGLALSGGQRQRVGLARALFGSPFLVVLDEPNSNLDVEGDAALATAIQGVRARGGIVAIVSHRPTVLACVDLVAIVTEGRIKAFGPRDEVLKAQVAANQASAAQPARAAQPLTASFGARA